MEFPKGKGSTYFWIFIVIFGIIIIIAFGLNIRNIRKILTFHTNLKKIEMAGIVTSISTDRSMTILKLNKMIANNKW